MSESGALLYGFDPLIFFSWHFKRVIEFSLISADKPVSITQRTESARVPVVITTLTYPTAVLELRTFAHQDDSGRRTDVVLWEIRVNDDIDEILTGLHMDLTEQGIVFTGRSVAPAHDIFAVPIEKFDAARILALRSATTMLRMRTIRRRAMWCWCRRRNAWCTFTPPAFATPAALAPTAHREGRRWYAAQSSCR